MCLTTLRPPESDGLIGVIARSAPIHEVSGIPEYQPQYRRRRSAADPGRYWHNRMGEANRFSYFKGAEWGRECPSALGCVDGARWVIGCLRRVASRRVRGADRRCHTLRRCGDALSVRRSPHTGDDHEGFADRHEPDGPWHSHLPVCIAPGGVLRFLRPSWGRPRRSCARR